MSGEEETTDKKMLWIWIINYVSKDNKTKNVDFLFS